MLCAPRAFGRAWNLAGVGITTEQALVERIYAAAGEEPRFFVAGKTALRLMGLFDRTLREMVEMHYLMTTPVLLDDRALHTLLGDIHKTPYEEGIRRTLAATRAAMPMAGPAVLRPASAHP
jgi:hypothetical protein